MIGSIKNVTFCLVVNLRLGSESGRRCFLLLVELVVDTFLARYAQEDFFFGLNANSFYLLHIHLCC